MANVYNVTIQAVKKTSSVDVCFTERQEAENLPNKVKNAKTLWSLKINRKTSGHFDKLGGTADLKVRPNARKH